MIAITKSSKLEEAIRDRGRELLVCQAAPSKPVEDNQPGCGKARWSVLGGSWKGKCYLEGEATNMGPGKGPGLTAQI